MIRRIILGAVCALIFGAPAYAQDIRTPSAPSVPASTTVGCVQYNNSGAFGCPSGIIASSPATITLGVSGTAGSVVIQNSTPAKRLYMGAQAGGAIGVIGGTSIFLGWSSNIDPTAAVLDTAFSRDSADVVNVGNGTTNDRSGTLQAAKYNLGTTLTISGTAATISAAGGLGTSPSITANGSAAMDITAGSSTSAATFTIGLPTAANGWVCNGSDITTQSITVFALKQVGGSATTAVMELFTTGAIAAAPVAGDHLRISCMAY